MPPKKNSTGEVVFSAFPEFRPNLTPREIFSRGSFGGTYWRPINSSVTGVSYKNKHKCYPKSWWKGIPVEWMVTDFSEYDKSVNKYNVRVGTTLQYWESKDWICRTHPYGWVQWYCDFYSGKRSHDDARQIKRWVRTAGPKSRFRRALINLVHAQKTSFDDVTISPKRRQTLQHWGYVLTPTDCG